MLHFIWRESLDMLQNVLLLPCGRAEVDLGIKEVSCF